MIKIVKVNDWLSNLFLRDRKNKSIRLDDCCTTLAAEYFFKELAIESCINLIADTISQCEFQTFEKGKATRGNNYYLLNVEPNQNQNASEFIHQLISQLLRENECLVIMQNDFLYVADSYDCEEYALYENKYSNIKVGSLVFEKTFYEKEVLHFKLNDKNIKQIMDGMYESYGKLISSSMAIFKRSNAKRVYLKGKFARAQDNETQAAINEMFASQFKAWFNPDNAGTVFQLPDEYELKDMSGTPTNSRDIKALIDDAIDYITMGFNVPKNILKGDTVGINEQIDGFLIFRINPIAELLQAEFNRKVYTKAEYLERTHLNIDTRNIKVIDVVKFATAADKLFSIGAYCVNDILEKLGLNPINEEWADKRFITKNYESAENRLKGGEEVAK